MLFFQNSFILSVHHYFRNIEGVNRRQFIHNSILASASAAMVPSLFSSCRKENLLPDINYNGRVIVVGAGVSGLYAAHLLKSKGAQVSILEASGLIGGRIRPLKNFADFTIELGAEEVHGEKSAYFKWLKNSGVDFVKADSRDFLFDGNNLHDVDDLISQSGFSSVDQVIRRVENGQYAGPDQSVLAYMNSQGVSAEYIPYGNALLANENGTSSDRISVRGLSDANNLWSSGSKNFLLKNSNHLDFLTAKFGDVLPLISLNSPVSEVNFEGSQITVKSAQGNLFECDKLVLTVPLGVLKSGSITFSPNLPSEKSLAISRIGFGTGMKVIIKFSQRFWPADLGSLYGSGPVPEYWSTGLGRSQSNNVLTAFVMGEKAEMLSQSGSSIITTILQDLDSMYNGKATQYYQQHVVMDWSQEPFISGSYSFAAIGEGPSDRTNLFSPVAEKLYFAGEACNTRGHFATIHGALETAFDSVKQLLEETV